MRPFNKVSTAIWASLAFRALSDDGRLLLLFFITSAHQTVYGCFHLPDGYATTDIQWPLERYRQARAELVSANLIMFDAATSEILILKWFKHCRPMNPSHRKAVATAEDNVSSSELRAETLSAWKAADADAAAKVEKQGSPSAQISLLETAHMKRVR